MARPSKTDPLRNFKFRVKIEPSGNRLKTVAKGISDLGFSVVSGISVQNEVIPYREGGMNTHLHKMVGQSDYGPVTFSKGMFAHENALYQWQEFIHSWSQGGNQESGSTPTENDYRADILVVIYDHPISAGNYSTPGTPDVANATRGKAKLGYKLFNCWPAGYTLSDLNAGESSLLIQQMVVNHEGFQVVFADGVNEAISEQTLAGRIA